MEEDVWETHLAEKLVPAEEKVFNNVGRLTSIANETRIYPFNSEKE